MAKSGDGEGDSLGFDVGDDRRVYVSDRFNRRIQVFDEATGKGSPMRIKYYSSEHGEQPFAALAELLTAMARQRDDAAAGKHLALLEDLERSIESFDDLHR